jgi:hypothetical protein
VICKPSSHGRVSPYEHVCRHTAGHVPGFIAAQLAGAIVATLFFRWFPVSMPHADAVVVPQELEHTQ